MSLSTDEAKLSDLAKVARQRRAIGISGAMRLLKLSYSEAADCLEELQRRGVLLREPRWFHSGNQVEAHGRVQNDRSLSQWAEGDSNADELRELDDAQLQSLRKLNARLTALEQCIDAEARAIDARCSNRIASGDGWLDDYEIDLDVAFELRSGDPEYRDDDDNYLAQLWEPLARRQSGDCGIADGVNHNQYADRDGHPLAGEHFCWLFHCLYTHAGLSWADVLRIESIHVDICVRYQHVDLEAVA